MSAFNKILSWAGLEAEEAEETMDFEPAETTRTAPKREKSRIAGSFARQASGMEVIINRIEDFEDSKEVVINLKNRRPVIINLELLDSRVARRCIDFICGAVLALDGNIQKVTEGIFVVTPNNIDIASDFRGEYESELEL